MKQRNPGDQEWGQWLEDRLAREYNYGFYMGIGAGVILNMAIGAIMVLILEIL